ncbi:MAG: amino acid ABC transporter permease [bacterium]
MYDFDFDLNVIIEAYPYILEGLKITLLISVTSSFFAFIIGVTIAFLRNTNNSTVKFLCVAYVEIIRNTPLLVQIYLCYKGLPNIGINLPPLLCGILTLSIYTGTFIAEVFRSGINSIAHEQYEAARGLGLSRLQTFSLVVFPQAIRIIIPPLGSQFINLLKNSSLVSFIAVGDLFYVIYKGAVDDFRFFEFFFTGAIIYMCLTGIIAIIANLLEYKFKIQGRTVKI